MDTLDDFISGGDATSVTELRELERPVILNQPTSETRTNETFGVSHLSLSHWFDKIECVFIKDPDPENGQMLTTLVDENNRWLFNVEERTEICPRSAADNTSLDSYLQALYITDAENQILVSARNLVDYHDECYAQFDIIDLTDNLLCRKIGSYEKWCGNNTGYMLTSSFPAGSRSQAHLLSDNNMFPIKVNSTCACCCPNTCFCCCPTCCCTSFKITNRRGKFFGRMGYNLPDHGKLFGISLPPTMNVRTKVVLLMSSLLMHWIYFKPRGMVTACGYLRKKLFSCMVQSSLGLIFSTAMCAPIGIRTIHEKRLREYSRTEIV